MTETQGTEKQDGEDTGNTVNVEGDAVVNNAPDGGGVDNNTESSGNAE